MRVRSLLAVTLLALVATACTDEQTPVEPVSAQTGLAEFTQLASADINGRGGIDGFHFAAPIAQSTVLPDDRDETLLDLLAVEICEWNGSSCASAPIRRFDATSTGAVRLRLEDGIYRTVWNSREDALDPQRSYRIRVLASGAEVGYVGLRIIAPGTDKHDNTSNGVRLPQNAALPIAFVLEPGAGERVTPGESTVELADGLVSLALPADAVSGDIFLTAEPVDEATLPLGRAIVPGSAWDMGPDGLVFDKPVVLSFKIDLSKVPAGVDPAELRIHKVVNNEYVLQPAGRVDLVNGVISAEIDGFSILVAVQRDLTKLEDVEAPSVTSLSVKTPSMTAFSNLIEVDVSSGNVPYTYRVALTDDAAGVSFIDLRYISPTGRQVRFTCYTGAPANSGSDTNGEWDCNAELPRYAESGDWTPEFFSVRDRVNNVVTYFRRPAGFCNAAQTQCIAAPPILRVLTSTNDITAPVVTTPQVSLNSQPRAFTQSLVVTSSASPQTLVVGFNASDDLAGVGNGLFFDTFLIQLRGPSSQSVFVYPLCSLRSGTELNGFWECTVDLPAQAATGVWTLQRFRVPDRAGNGGWSSYADFFLNASNDLCNRDAVCIDAFTVEVLGAGDSEAPLLQSFAVTANGAEVTTTMRITDATSGTESIVLSYQSALTSQTQTCFLNRTAGTPNDGTWSCTITFPSLAALGSWVPRFTVRDIAGNTRFYTRRSTDGFLCYFDPITRTQQCADFGDTELTLK